MVFTILSSLKSGYLTCLGDFTSPSQRPKVHLQTHLYSSLYLVNEEISRVLQRTDGSLAMFLRVKPFLFDEEGGRTLEERELSELVILAIHILWNIGRLLKSTQPIASTTC